MRFYQFHPGDYLRDTAHLTPLEDCIYRRALDWLYSNEKPLPIDSVASARLLRVVDHSAAVGVILAEFLTETPEGWISNRANEQIEQYRKMSEGGTAGAKKRWGKESGESVQTDKVQSLSDAVPTGSPEADLVGEVIAPPLPPLMLTSNQKPVTNNHIKNIRTSDDQNRPPNAPPIERPRRSAAPPGVFVSEKQLVELGVDKQAAADWLATRKAKRLPLTKTAMQAVIDEAGKAGITPAQAVTLAAKEGWAGFKASWIKTAKPESLSFIELHADKSWRHGLEGDNSFADKYSDRSWADGLLETPTNKGDDDK